MRINDILCVEYMTKLCIILVTLSGVLSSQDQISSDEVKIQPGGEVHTFEKTVAAGVKCKFTYSAQGGTNERWYIQVAHSKDNTHFVCSVHRPEGTSYLFFMTFELSVHGAKVVGAQANGNSGPLSGDQYAVDKKKNTVHHVEGKFKSQLTQVEVKAQRGKSEL